MLTKDYLKSEDIELINEILQEHQEGFKDSKGVRSKQGLNGRTSIFETMKYFDMPVDVREAVDSVLPLSEVKEALEVYFLRFPEGGFLDDYKAIPTCFLECKAVLLSDVATVTVSGLKHTMIKGYTITIPLKEIHSVANAPYLTDFLVLLKIKK